MLAKRKRGKRDLKSEEKLMCLLQVGKVCRSISIVTARGGASNTRRGGGEAKLMYEVVFGTPIGGRMARHEGVAAASKESSAVAAG